MRTATKNKFIRHALEDYPREAAGFVLAAADREVYFPARNVADDDNDFRIPAQDYAAAEEAGQIVAVIHSHVDRGPEPSETDRVSCEATGVPWHILSVRGGDGGPYADEWHSFAPCGYVAPLVGRSFHHGSLDCLGLVRDFYEREMGIELPNMDRADDWWNKPGTGEMYLDNYEAWGFEAISGDPQFGDVVFMQYHSDRTNHAGVYLGDQGLKSQQGLHTFPNAMLHHAMGRLSERVIYGGYWADITRMIVRYKGV